MLNFANDITINTAQNKLTSTLKQDSQTAIDWFKRNKIIVNPDKFQAIIDKKNCRMKDFYALNTIPTTKLLKLKTV